MHYMTRCVLHNAPGNGCYFLIYFMFVAINWRTRIAHCDWQDINSNKENRAFHSQPLVSNKMLTLTVDLSAVCISMQCDQQCENESWNIPLPNLWEINIIWSGWMMCGTRWFEPWNPDRSYLNATTHLSILMDGARFLPLLTCWRIQRSISIYDTPVSRYFNPACPYAVCWVTETSEYSAYRSFGSWCSSHYSLWILHFTECRSYNVEYSEERYAVNAGTTFRCMACDASLEKKTVMHYRSEVRGRRYKI